MTLFETVMTIGLFVVVTSFSAPLLTNITSFYTETIFASDLMESTKIAQERLFDDLLSARIISLSSGDTPSLVFVVPVDVTDGAKVDFMGSRGKVHWGAVEAGGPREDLSSDLHRFTLTAVPSRKVDESKAHLDLNNDGDLQDYFVLGSLRVQTTGGMETVFNSDRLVLYEPGSSALDIDGDKLADPLFKIDGESFTDSNANGIHDEGEEFVDTSLNGIWDGVLTVNLLAFNSDRDGRGHSFVYRTRIHLRNN